jgi:hypothetical protein
VELGCRVTVVELKYFLFSDHKAMNTPKFDGSQSLMKCKEHLMSMYGYGIWLDDFRATHHKYKEFFTQLLKGLFTFNLCCAIVGGFLAYVAGLFHSFDSVTLAIAVTDSPILDQLFSKKWILYVFFDWAV